MPAPTATCMICNQTVTKRSTLSLDFLGLGDGRACRSHPEVQKAREMKEREDRRNKSLALAEFSLRVMAATAAARVMHSFFGWPLSVILYRLNLPKAVEQVVLMELEDKGLQMRSDEMLDTVLHASLVAQTIEQSHIGGSENE